jgi:hypothetical protein
MRIEMLKRTYNADLGFLNYGDTLETGKKLDKATAERWVKIGLAKEVEVKQVKKDYVKPEILEINDIHVSEEEPTNVEVETEEANEETEVVNEVSEDNYSDYSAKELFGMCKDLNLDVEPKMSREYYIEMLTLNA